MEADCQPHEIQFRNLHQVITNRSIGRTYRHNLQAKTPLSFLYSVQANQSLVSRLKCQKELSFHRGCVNTDDTYCVVWDMREGGDLSTSFPTGHTANIFCTRFMPESDNKRIITCAGDSEVRAFALAEGKPATTHVFTSHYSRVKKLVCLDANSFLSCSEDGTVRLYDLRERAAKGGSVVVNLGTIDVNCIAMSGTTFCIGCGDPRVRVYDFSESKKSITPFAMFSPLHLSQVRSGLGMQGHVTNGKEVLASYSGDKIYLFDVDETDRAKPSTPSRAAGRRRPVHEIEEEDDSEQDGDGDEDQDEDEDEDEDNDYEEQSSEEEHEAMVNVEAMDEESESSQEESSGENSSMEAGGQNADHNELSYFKHSYSGHCNVKTVKGVSFFGPDDNYVCSGSDDGRIFIWNKATRKIVNIKKGDSSVVNVISGHPFDPILATSGIDNEIKIWAPTRTEPKLIIKNEDNITQRNREMMTSMSNGGVISLAFLRQFIRRRDEAGENVEGGVECGLQ